MANYQCVDCGGGLVPNSLVSSSADGFICLACRRIYKRQSGVLLAWPSEMHRLAQEEAEHHDSDESDACEVHQLTSPRNLFYHGLIWGKMRALPVGSRILEIGAGSGFDASRLQSDYNLTLSDVSVQSLLRLQGKLSQARPSGTLDFARSESVESSSDRPLDLVAADGAHLPFADGSFDGVYLVATLHHLPYPDQGLAECARLLRPGGRIVIGLEPNRFYFLPIKKLRRLLCRLTHMDPRAGSHADAEMEGFSHGQLKVLLQTDVWQDVQIRPAWLLVGWWHYLAEFLFRAFRLRKRLVLPESWERGLVKIDEFLFKIPGVKHLGWHWLVFARRRL